MNIFHATACLALITLSTPLHAAEQIVEIQAESSGRLWANYTHGDCCDLDSFTSNESTISVRSCETMGGYCMAGTWIATWLFDMPDFPENATVVSATFEGRHNGGGASFTYRGSWTSYNSLGYSSALNAWNSYNLNGTGYSSGGNFSISLPIELDQGQWQSNSLIMSGYRGDGLAFYNSGTIAPRISLVIHVPDEICLGDVTGDDIVDISDLLGVISGWGNPYTVSDLLTVIQYWGTPCMLPGACCMPDGTCESTDEFDCEYAGGQWNGSNTYCSIVDCPELGACCWDDKNCEVLLSDACKNGGGSFRGADTNCSTIDCAIAEYNDECVDATPITNGATTFTTIEATNSTDVYSSTQCVDTYLGAMSQDIWFSYQATCTGTLVVSTCDNASFDTDLVVYEGACSDMTQIACNGDATCSGYTSYLETPVTSGTNYLIRLGGWDDANAGTGTLQVSCD